MTRGCGCLCALCVELGGFETPAEWLGGDVCLVGRCGLPRYAVRGGIDETKQFRFGLFVSVSTYTRALTLT